MREFVTAIILLMAFGSLLANANESEKVYAKCMDTHDVTEDDLEIMRNTEIGFNYPRKVQCFMSCLANHTKFFDEKGKINYNVSIASLQTSLAEAPEEAHKATVAITRCKDEIGSDPCETAAKIYYCLKMAST
ncbi:uncharacterized protein LOC132200448 [Neocloeon triangulifer]|uniref:uncharacterized protein LOC132200448 n=1 Tax=Neocloeon triangulifer TaxID=2078957 RepID=UPI00286FA231|nr:uncharacterized protein LOC132200448 [Neocloeon triangulifer]